MRLALTLPLLALSACAPGNPLTIDENPGAVQRAWANVFSDQPFDTGPVSVVTAEHGEMHTYTFVPCRGDKICAGSAHGRVMQISRTADHVVISGTRSGREFYLGAGGGGWLKKNGQQLPLAWDDSDKISLWAVTRVTDQGVGLETDTQ